MSSLDELNAMNLLLLIFIADVVQVIAFGFRNQIKLRSWLLASTIIYTIYYFLAAQDQSPLWDVILISAALSVINLWVLVLLVMDNLTRLPEKQQKIYKLFCGFFSPGMFARLVSIGEIKTSQETIELIVEGQEVDNLYFVVNNKIIITKQDRKFDYSAGSFIGEVVYLTGGRASATVCVPPNTDYIVWKNSKLKAIAQKNPKLDICLKAILSLDIAKKVQYS